VSRKRTPKTLWALSVEHRTRTGKWPGSKQLAVIRDKLGYVREGPDYRWFSSVNTVWYLDEIAESTSLKELELEAGALELGLRPPGTEHVKGMIPRVGSRGEDNLARLVAYCWVRRTRRMKL
jgi:hypothetical protein